MSDLPLTCYRIRIIAVPVYLPYYLEVVEQQGSQELADRAYELYLKYRDMEEIK